MDNLIKLPSYEWFLGLMGFGGKGNVYAGSYGTDPYRGCLVSETFRYRVWIDKDENDEKLLKAVHYIGQECFDETDSKSMTEKNFDATSDGIIEAQNWLIDELGSFIKTH